VPSNIDLSLDQLTAVVGCVEAIVDHDSGRLEHLVRGDGDIYLWTRDYGRYGTVELVRPPGDPTTWAIDAVQVTAADRPAVSVNVPMWTTQEGRSDLTLGLTITQAHDGRWQARIDDLHVL
jgi:hypothetical protein